MKPRRPLLAGAVHRKHRQTDRTPDDPCPEAGSPQRAIRWVARCYCRAARRDGRRRTIRRGSCRLPREPAPHWRRDRAFAPPAGECAPPPAAAPALHQDGLHQHVGASGLRFHPTLRVLGVPVSRRSEIAHATNGQCDGRSRVCFAPFVVPRSGGEPGSCVEVLFSDEVTHRARAATGPTGFHGSEAHRARSRRLTIRAGSRSEHNGRTADLSRG